jgi:hypothetical protein
MNVLAINCTPAGLPNIYSESCLQLSDGVGSWILICFGLTYLRTVLLQNFLFLAATTMYTGNVEKKQFQI